MRYKLEKNLITTTLYDDSSNFSEKDMVSSMENLPKSVIPAGIIV